MPGTGDPGYKIKAEFNKKSHVRGVISMARSSHPDSAGSQFFLCHGDAKFLDNQYTGFGQLIAGDDVLEQLANVPTKSGGGGEKSTPIDRVALESVTIVAQPYGRPRAELTQPIPCHKKPGRSRCRVFLRLRCALTNQNPPPWPPHHK